MAEFILDLMIMVIKILRVLSAGCIPACNIDPSAEFQADLYKAGQL